MGPSKEEFRDKILMLIAENKRKKKRQHIYNEVDIHGMENSRNIKKRTRHKGGTSYFDD